MKSIGCAIIVFAMAIVVPVTRGQDAVAPASGQKSLAATMNVYVFPTKGQNQEQQGIDETSCYSWAVSQTGTDPFQLQKQSQAQQQQAKAAEEQAATVGTGAGAAGAVRGAAAGALIGEIASDDPGKGAAYGAAAGLIAGSRRKRMARHEAQKQAAAQSERAQQGTASELENFKKAFSVCLDAKDYMVKY